MMSGRKRKHSPSDEKHLKLLQSKEEGQNTSTGPSRKKRKRSPSDEEQPGVVLDNLGTQLQQSEEERHHVSISLEEGNKTIEVLEQEFDATKDAKDGSLTSLKEAYKTIERPEKELDATKNAKYGSLTSLEEANKTIERLEKELDATNNSKDGSLTSLEEANKTIERLKKELDATNNSKDGSLINLEEATTTIERLKQELDATNNANDGSLTRLKEANKTNKRLEKLLDATKTEKDNALTRLSEMMSVKLRDNNPNIADLSDPNRPTKLAEMFSELYDNEWTDTFTVLNVTFTERQSISVLLDIVMAAYDFCTDDLDSTWKVVSTWYLNDALPNAQQLAKNLKDSRKTLVPRMAHDVTQKFIEKLHSTCGIQQLKELLSSEKVVEYISQSVKLCLLMCASDPPVVIVCQETHRDTTTLSGEDANNDKRQHKEDVCGSKGSGKEKGAEITHHSDAGGRRAVFNKEKFKEYTSRGPYLEYVVWPVMYLHQGGPMLGKGVAQGTREPVESVEEAQWTWKKLE